VIIRTYQPGDEAAQIGIYNDACAALPKFKPATLDETRRRCRSAEFDPGTRFFAIEEGQAVGYATFHANGRISYPWCRPGHERFAEPLLDVVFHAMRGRGMTRAFAAYRADWQPQADFFLSHGFEKVREMVNYWLDPADMPTPAVRRSYPIASAQPPDVPAIFDLVPKALRASCVADLHRHLFDNPYFGREAVFVLRDRTDPAILAAGVLVTNSAYADPRQVDAAMPCFRLGAFGTEGMQTKRMNGLFSFLAREGHDFIPLALDLLAHAAFKLSTTDVTTLAAQVPSDVPHLHRFYEDRFRRQGSFPVFERAL
jgi:hypothetical protein